MAKHPHGKINSGMSPLRAAPYKKFVVGGGYPEAGPEQASRYIVPPAESGNKTTHQHTTKPAKERAQKVHRCARMMCRCAGMMYRCARRVYRYPTDNASEGI